MKVLVTGFDSFPGVAINPSRLLVEEIKDCSVAGLIIETEILPVDYEYCRDWSNSLSGDHDLIIHVGVASTPVNRLEMQAKNVCGDHRDIKGRIGPSPIKNDSEAILRSAFPVKSLHESLGFPCELSFDAGEYLCNFIYYQSLCRSPSGSVFFYHISPLEVFSLDQQVEWFVLMLRDISSIN